MASHSSESVQAFDASTISWSHVRSRISYRSRLVCRIRLDPHGTAPYIWVVNYNLVGGTSSTRTRRGGSCLKDIYKRPFSSIELACAVRQPSPCVHAFFESGVLFHMSHLKLLFTLHTWQSSRSTLHSSHCALHTALFALHTPHSSHFTLHSSHSTLHTSQSTLHTSHFSLLSSHSTLHTALFTPHTSHCTLHTPHFISSELFSPYPSSSLLISSLFICHLSFHESLPSTTTKELACAVRQPGPCVRALCEAVAVLLSKNMTCARPRYNANTFLTLHIALLTPHTPHFTLALHLNSSHLSSSHLIPCLPICQPSSSWLFLCQVLPSTVSTTKACKNHFPVLLCTTKLAQNTSQYYFVLQSLHKALPSTTLYYKACTNYFPVLLCTTKLAQNMFQYYFVLQSLHKTLSSTTLYYKACTKHFPVLLCTTKLAQSTSQYYFVLQSLHKALPSTTLYYKACTNTFQYYFVLQSLHKALPSTTVYYKACTKHVPVLLCTTKLAQNTFQYYFVLQSFYTHQVLSQRSFYTQQAFQAEKLLHTEAFTHNKLLHREAFTHSKRLHTETFAQRRFYTQRGFYTQQAFTHKIFFTQQAFKHSKRSHTEHLHTVLLHMASVYTEAF